MIEDRWRDRDGVQLHYLVQPGATDLLPLVYLPGSLGRAEEVRAEMERLAPRATLAVDERGVCEGEDAPPRPPVYTPLWRSEMCIDSPEDLQGMKRAAKVAKTALRAMRAALRPGISTLELDRLARAVFERYGARSAPAMEYGFPGTVLISVNDEAVHGIPGQRAIREGDLVKLDVTPWLDGYVADAAVTVAMPEASLEARRLARCAERALELAIAAVRPGRPVNVLGRVVENAVAAEGFSVLGELGGHGVGRSIHEEPTVLNVYEPSLRRPLTEGLVFTIEPIVAAGGSGIVTDTDGWTVRTTDGSLAAHVEHTVVVTRGAARVLTA